MITSRKLLSLAALVTLAATLLAGAAALAADVEIQVVPRDTQTEIGKTMVLDVDFTLPAGVVLPSSSLALEVITDGEGEILDEPYPLVFTSHPKEDGQAVLLQGPVKVEWAAQVLGKAQPGSHHLQVKLLANGRAIGTWSGTVEVGFGEGWNEDRIQSFIENRGKPLFLLLVFGFGLLMSLSPCIYPMIPITLAVIGAQAPGGHQLHARHGHVPDLRPGVGPGLRHHRLHRRHGVQRHHRRHAERLGHGPRRPAAGGALVQHVRSLHPAGPGLVAEQAGRSRRSGSRRRAGRAVHGHGGGAHRLALRGGPSCRGCCWCWPPSTTPSWPSRPCSSSAWA